MALFSPGWANFNEFGVWVFLTAMRSLERMSNTPILPFYHSSRFLSVADTAYGVTERTRY